MTIGHLLSPELDFFVDAATDFVLTDFVLSDFVPSDFVLPDFVGVAGVVLAEPPPLVQAAEEPRRVTIVARNFPFKSETSLVE